MADDDPRLHAPPFIHVQGIHNFRDVGGYPITLTPPANPSISSTSSPIPTSQPGPAPPSVRRARLYRSAEPSHITPLGTATLHALGVTTLYDLRSGPELAKNAALTPVVEVAGVERRVVPVFAETDFGPEALAVRYRDYTTTDSEGFKRAYLAILLAAPPAYRAIMRHLAVVPEPEPCLIHCTAGKDRTGVFVALLLSLLGVDDETIATEYALTEIGLAAWREVIVDHLMKEPLCQEGGRAGALNMISAKAVNMRATLEMIRERWGGAEEYFVKECGLSHEELERVRRNMIVEPAELSQ